jgi:hypothetical protein
MAVLGSTLPRSASVAAPITKEKLTGATKVTIGGLSGTYDLTLGSYGAFAGAAQIIGQKAAKLANGGSEIASGDRAGRGVRGRISATSDLEGLGTRGSWPGRP